MAKAVDIKIEFDELRLIDLIDFYWNNFGVEMEFSSELRLGIAHNIDDYIKFK